MIINLEKLSKKEKAMTVKEYVNKVELEYIERQNLSKAKDKEEEQERKNRLTKELESIIPNAAKGKFYAAYYGGNRLQSKVVSIIKITEIYIGYGIEIEASGVETSFVQWHENNEKIEFNRRFGFFESATLTPEHFTKFVEITEELYNEVVSATKETKNLMSLVSKEITDGFSISSQLKNTDESVIDTNEIDNNLTINEIYSKQKEFIEANKLYNDNKIKEIEENLPEYLVNDVYFKPNEKKLIRDDDGYYAMGKAFCFFNGNSIGYITNYKYRVRNTKHTTAVELSDNICNMFEAMIENMYNSIDDEDIKYFIKNGKARKEEY